jgi:hypothetical protein
MSINGRCPHCNADLDGELVIETYRKQEDGKTDPRISASFHEGWEQYGELNRWGRQVVIYNYRSDRTEGYECPDCGGTWKR